MSAIQLLFSGSNFVPRVNVNLKVYLVLLFSLLLAFISVFFAIYCNSALLLNYALYTVAQSALILGGLVVSFKMNQNKKEQEPRYNWRNLGMFVNTLVLLCIQFQMINAAISHVVDPIQANLKGASWIACFTLVARLGNIYIMRYTATVAYASKAKNRQFITDTACSASVLLGIWILNQSSLWWLDGVLALFIVVLVGRWSLELILQSAKTLLGVPPEHLKAKEIAKDIYTRYGVVQQEPEVICIEPEPGRSIVRLKIKVFPAPHLEYKSLKIDVLRRLDKNFGIKEAQIELDW